MDEEKLVKESLTDNLGKSNKPINTKAFLDSKLKVFKNLNTSQKVTVITFLLLFISLPIGVTVTVSPKVIRYPYATPITPPLTTTPTLAQPITVQPTPTFIPTPLPTPGYNKAPVFITNHLKVGIIRKEYKSVVSAIDPDGNQLQIQITDLAPGLGQGECKFFLNNRGYSRLDCVINGLPKQAGIFYPKAKVTDQYGAYSTKTFRQIILPRLTIY